MLIDPKDPFKSQRDQVNEFELREVNRIIEVCKDMGPEIFKRMLDDNKKSFDGMREEFKKRGINI